MKSPDDNEPDWIPTGDDRWWLELWSAPDRWREHQAQAIVTDVLERFTDEAIGDILGELRLNGLCADRVVLLNLLRHWAAIELGERRISDGTDHDKRLRSKSKELNKALKTIGHALNNHSSSLAYALSQHLDHPLRVHRAYSYCNELQMIARELQPAAARLAAGKLKRGPKEDLDTKRAIEGLIQIYEFTTGAVAGRTVDPNDHFETGPFHAFAERCMRALHGSDHKSIDSPIRTVLRERSERRSKLLPKPKAQAGLGDDL